MLHYSELLNTFKSLLLSLRGKCYKGCNLTLKYIITDRVIWREHVSHFKLLSRAELPNLLVKGIWGQMILCCGALAMEVSSIPGLHTLNVNSALPSVVATNSLQTLPNVSLGTKSPWLRVTAAESKFVLKQLSFSSTTKLTSQRGLPLWLLVSPATRRLSNYHNEC